MDTRNKIIPFSELGSRLKEGKWIAVAGTFDPLTIFQARRLAGYATEDRKLLVVIDSEDESLLPADARAVLVAGLREVHAVTVARPPGDYNSLAANANVRLVSDRKGEQKRTAEFKDFVIGRQNA